MIFFNKCGIEVDGDFECGCTYLGKDLVLTAAHCVDEQIPFDNFSTYFVDIILTISLLIILNS